MLYKDYNKAGSLGRTHPGSAWRWGEVSEKGKVDRLGKQHMGTGESFGRTGESHRG